MSLAVTATPGFQLGAEESVTNDKLNALGQPVLALAGSADRTQVGARVVNWDKADWGAWFWGTDGGGSDAHDVTLANSTLTDWVTGLVVAFVAAGESTGAACTLELTGASAFSGGAKAITKLGSVPIEHGDIRQGQVVVVRYDGTRCQMVSPVGNPPHIRGTTTGSSNAYLLDASGTDQLSRNLDGRRVMFKANHTNTGAATLAVSDNVAKSLTKNGTSALVAGDIVTDRWYEAIYDGTQWQIVSGLALPVTTAIVGQSRGLVITNKSGSEDSQLDISADDVVLFNTTGQALKVTGVSVSANMASSGANGLDTGSESSSTWYYVWLISDGSTTACLLSASASAPTLPGSYTYQALVGAIYNDGSSNFHRMWQFGREVSLEAQEVIDTAAPGTADTWETEDLSAIVPPIAKRARGNAGATEGTAIHGFVAVAGDANGLGQVVLAIYYAGTSVVLENFGAGGPFLIPLKTASTLYWKGRTTDSRYRIEVTGYEI